MHRCHVSGFSVIMDLFLSKPSRSFRGMVTVFLNLSLVFQTVFKWTGIFAIIDAKRQHL